MASQSPAPANCLNGPPSPCALLLLGALAGLFLEKLLVSDQLAEIPQTNFAEKLYCASIRLQNTQVGKI